MFSYREFFLAADPPWNICCISLEMQVCFFSFLSYFFISAPNVSFLCACCIYLSSMHFSHQWILMQILRDQSFALFFFLNYRDKCGYTNCIHQVRLSPWLKQQGCGSISENQWLLHALIHTVKQNCCRLLYGDVIFLQMKTVNIKQGSWKYCIILLEKKTVFKFSFNV